MMQNCPTFKDSFSIPLGHSPVGGIVCPNANMLPALRSSGRSSCLSWPRAWLPTRYCSGPISSVTGQNAIQNVTASSPEKPLYVESWCQEKYCPWPPVGVAVGVVLMLLLARLLLLPMDSLLLSELCPNKWKITQVCEK